MARFSDGSAAALLFRQGGDAPDSPPTRPACRINLFKALSPDLSYLKEMGKAEQQAQEKCLYRLGSSEIVLDRSILTFSGTANVTPFIWEGAADYPQTGDVILECRMDGTVIGRKKVRLILKDVTSFYDLWNAESAAGYYLESGRGQHSSSGQQDYYWETKPDEYLLVCHGFNVDCVDKRHWPATIFKRLWWMNFPGRLGFFKWNCVLHAPVYKADQGTQNPDEDGLKVYDNSDFKAWHTGGTLKGVLEALKSAGFSLHLLAHSQGNIVAGNALRLLHLSPGEAKIKTYLATQAAISSSCYENCPRAYFWTQKCPDVRAHYPGYTDDKPFLASVKNNVENLYSFYNPVDYALQSACFTSWKRNNSLRPDFDYDYLGDGRHYLMPGSREKLGRYFKSSGKLLPTGQQELFFPEIPSDCDEIQEVKDTYEIFSFGSHAWGEPLGMLPRVGNFSGIALESLGFDKYHYSHSRQFRSNLPEVLPYWKTVMDKCGLKTEGIAGESHEMDFVNTGA